MSEIEGATCDDCGSKVPPWGCCGTSRARVQEIDWLRDREIKWRDAALNLRAYLYAHHESDTQRRIAEGGADLAHLESICKTCALLKETRWCMEILPERGRPE